MDYAVGGIKRGWAEIKAVYAQIFSHPQPFWFEFYDYSYHQAGEVFYVVGRELDDQLAGAYVVGANDG